MNPLYLGTTARRIFAIHEPPAATDCRPRAAVLCYPWDTEYTYAHRSMRQLASRLSMSCYHTLRFDYFGTGDSNGDASQADLAGCESDVELAIETVMDIAGVSQVALIGLRAGANVAERVALRLRSAVAALVLWDPIVSGDLPGSDFRADIGSLPERTLILVTQHLDEHQQLTEAAGAKPVPMELVSAPCPWIEAATTTGALPMKAIQRIEEWLR